MKKTTSALLALVLVVPLMFTLSSCAENYTQSDVEQYVREELGIKEFTIADEPVVKKNVRGGDSNYWTITTDWYGLDQPLTFEVEEFCMTDDIPHCTLLGDPSEAIDEALSRMYHPSGKLTGVKKEGTEDKYFYGCHYPISSRSDFEAAWPEIQKFQKFLRKYPRIAKHSVSIYYDLESPNEAEQNAGAYLFPYEIAINANSTHEDFLNQLRTPQEDWSDLNVVDWYLKDCLELGLRTHVEEFSDEEIASLIESENMHLVLDGNGEVLDSTIVWGESASIAYGNLFELAKAAGLQVEGTWAQFEVHGADGQVYAFSYEYPEYGSMGLENAPQVKKEVAEQILGFSLVREY